MSATRTLILGVLLDGPLNGYRVRRRLELWRADGWANVAYGSIYHGLAKMAEEGLLEVVEGGRGARTVYGITADGRAEFRRRLLRSWAEVEAIVDPFQVALTFMDRLDRPTLVELMRVREEQLRLILGTLGPALQGKRDAEAPRHIAENLRLIAAQLRTQLDWLGSAAPRVESGDLP